MIDLKKRTSLKELLDNDFIPQLDLYQNLKELNFINTWLGGHQVTLKGLNKFEFEKGKTYTIIDIGCGGGDNLIYAAKWARSKGYNFKFIGIDLKKDCIEYAIIQSKNLEEISFICSDYRNLPDLNIQFDIALACLFTHHLSNNEISELLLWCNKNARLGFVINDLHRNIFAYYSIAWLTAIFSKSYLVKNDAKLSVARGFIGSDWHQILKQSKVTPSRINITWAWAFRWLVIGKNTLKNNNSKQ
jgi:2-polyprenyl-3-methyl-5-hydroxy-6-metoxy-1,4-benzoquinol methylase